MAVLPIVSLKLIMTVLAGISFMPVSETANSEIFSFVSWDLFFNTHQDVITACDFATYELVTPHGLQREHILFFENIATREVWLGGIAHDPDGNWMAQIGRNQCDMWKSTPAIFTGQ